MNPTTLTRAQKAAAILVAMGKPAAGRLLKFFKQEELKALMDGARTLRTIPQADLERIVAEFEGEFTEGAGLLDSADKMDTILTESLSQEEMDAILGHKKPVVADPGPAPVWPAIAKLEPERLTAILASEHPQTVALILSNLPSESAAAALLALSKPVRSDVLKRMLGMNNVPAAAKRIIENQLQARLLAEGTVKTSAIGQVRVASLLNELDKSQVDEVMLDLEQTGIRGLEEVRAKLFAFEDIVLLNQAARVSLFDGVSPDLVTLALRNADPALAEAVLSAIGARSRRMIESELNGESNAALADIVRARKSIAAQALALATNGALELPAAQQAAA
jgi:flagellar motor switch protein FliG